MIKKNHIKPAYVIFLFLLFIHLIVPAGLQADSLGTGLILPTEEELRSVPLASLPFSGSVLPGKVDLSPDLPPPGHQGKQNSCVGWTLAYAMKSYQEHKEEGRPLVTNTGKPNYKNIFSPAFIYNQLNYGRDGGVHIQVALRLLEEQGVCTWSDMPYSADDYRRQPDGTALAKARRYRINTWRRVNTQSTKEVKTHVQGGYPVVIGALVDEGFTRVDNPTGWIWRERLGRDMGAHAMLVVGYDDTRRAFKVINSWGRKWGEAGYGWIDYDHFHRVVPVGYVVMDAPNDPDRVVQPRKKERQESKSPQIRPTPVDPGVKVKVSSVSHNAAYPERPDLGKFLRMDGWLQIPGSAGRTDQVVIHFYHHLPQGQIGHRVASDMAQYRDVYGYAACGTAVYPIPAQGLDTTFTAWISYAAFRLPVGQWVQRGTVRQYEPLRSYLVGIPTLFVDNFGVANGQAIYFYVDK